MSTVQLTEAPDSPRKIFALVSNGRVDVLSTRAQLAVERTPKWQLFESTDNGVHWRRVGLSYLPGQKATARSNLPWNDAFILHAESGHRLYVTGSFSRTNSMSKPPQFQGLYCSVDDGLTWTKTC